MKILIPIFIIVMAVGCSTLETIKHPVPIGFFPDFKGEGFCIEIWMDNQPLPPGKEVAVSEKRESSRLSDFVRQLCF